MSDTHSLHNQLSVPSDVDIVVHSGDASNWKDPYRNESELLQDRNQLPIGVHLELGQQDPAFEFAAGAQQGVDLRNGEGFLERGQRDIADRQDDEHGSPAAEVSEPDDLISAGRRVVARIVVVTTEHPPWEDSAPAAAPAKKVQSPEEILAAIRKRQQGK